MTSLLMSSLPISTSHRLFRCRYPTSRDAVVSSPSSSRAPRRVCLRARKTLLFKIHFNKHFSFINAETDISRYSWENLCSRLKWSSKSWVSAVSKQQFLQSSKRSKTFERMCVVTRSRHSLSYLFFLLPQYVGSSPFSWPIQKSSWRDKNFLLPVGIHRNVW